MSQLSIEIEQVRAIRRSAEDLQAMHDMAIEHTKEIGSELKAELDWDSMQRLNDMGALYFLMARIEGKLVGYFTWIIDYDVSAKGTLVANQHAWYVKPGHPIIGVKLLDRAIKEFKKTGVQFAYMHSTVHGRGAGLDRLLIARGAKPHTRSYVMKVKHERL